MQRGGSGWAKPREPRDRCACGKSEAVMPALGKRLIWRLGGGWLQGTGQLRMFVDPDLGSAAHRQMPWLQVPLDGLV